MLPLLKASAGKNSYEIGLDLNTNGILNKT